MKVAFGHAAFFIVRELSSLITHEQAFSKLNKSLIILLLALLLLKPGFAQKVIQPERVYWEINIAYGPSIPVGKFKNTDIEPFFREQNGATFVDGFYKKDNGFAKVGYQISASVKKKLSKRLRLNIEFSYAENELEKELFDNSLLVKMIAGPVDYVQEPYQIISIIPSISFTLYEKGRSNIAVSLGYGWSQMEYPFYRAELFPEGSGSFIGQVNRLEDIQTSIFQLGLEYDYQLTKRLSLSVASIFRSGDYAYDSVVTLIPGGSTINERVDEVNLRVINFQLGLGYSIGKK